jgi:hypothetical protein
VFIEGTRIVESTSRTTTTINSSPSIDATHSQIIGQSIDIDGGAFDPITINTQVIINIIIIVVVVVVVVWQPCAWIPYRSLIAIDTDIDRIAIAISMLTAVITGILSKEAKDIQTSAPSK